MIEFGLVVLLGIFYWAYRRHTSDNEKRRLELWKRIQQLDSHLDSEIKGHEARWSEIKSHLGVLDHELEKLQFRCASLERHEREQAKHPDLAHEEPLPARGESREVAEPAVPKKVETPPRAPVIAPAEPKPPAAPLAPKPVLVPPAPVIPPAMAHGGPLPARAESREVAEPTVPKKVEAPPAAPVIAPAEPKPPAIPLAPKPVPVAPAPVIPPAMAHGGPLPARAESREVAEPAVPKKVEAPPAAPVITPAEPKPPAVPLVPKPVPIPPAPVIPPLSRDSSARLLEDRRWGEKRPETAAPPHPVQVPAPAHPVAKAPPPIVVKPPQPPPLTPPHPSAGEAIRPVPVQAQAAPHVAATPPAYPPLPVPRFLIQPPPGPPITERLKRLLNLEEVLGTNYLIKIGVVILVIGVAGFILSNFNTFPTWAQLSAGYLVGLAMLIGGVRYETSQYRILARSGMGGGWALIFFTTWALHHAHHPGEHPLLPWEAVDLVLMLIVAVAMVKHTLKYNSQLVTGFAFLLPTLTVTVTLGFASGVTDAVRIPGLVASAILALGLVVIVVRRRWFEMEVFGIVSTYLNHFFWIRPIVEHGSLPARSASLYSSAALLIAYWAIFRGSYIIRKVDDKRQEAISTVAGLLNTFLLLGLLKYQAINPKLAFWFLLALGAVELTLGQLPITKRRRAAFVILTTLGATFLVAALPYQFSGATLPVILLAETEAFFLAGVFTREIVFRRLGMLAGLLVAFKMDLLALEQITKSQFHGLVGTDALKATEATVVYGLAALVFYANSHWVPRRWPDLIQSSFEDWSFRGYSYIAGSVAFLGLWLIFPSPWVPVAWSALALMLAVAGQRLKIRQLVTQVPFFTAAATLGVVAKNFSAAGSFLHLSLPLVTVSLVAAMFYLTSRWERRTDLPGARLIAEVLTWVATALLGILVWHECPDVWRAVAWSAMALALALAGRGFKLREFFDQAHFLAVAGFAAALGFNLQNQEAHHYQSLPLNQWLPLGIVLLTAVLLYACSRHIRLTRLPGETLLSAAHSWTATLLLALLPWYALRAEFAAPAWMLLAFTGAVVGRTLKLKRFSFQAYGLALTAFLGALFISLIGTSPHTHILVRLGAVSCVATLLYICSHWAARVEVGGADAIRALHTWLGTALGALLAWYDAPAMWTSVAWAALALILIFLGQRTKHRDLSIQGFILTIAALISTLSVNLLPTQSHQHDSVRLITVLLVASLIYLSSYWAERVRIEGAAYVAVGQVWGASAVLALLAWYELRPEYAAPAWMVLAFAGAVVGRVLKLKRFSFQAYALALAAFVGALLINLHGTTHHTHIMLRLVAVSFVAALLYVCSHWAARVELKVADEVRALHTWLGTALVALLAWYETPALWTAVAWAALALILIFLGQRTKHRDLSIQSFILTTAALIGTLSVNLLATQPHQHAGIRWITVLLVVSLTYLSSYWTERAEIEGAAHVAVGQVWGASAVLALLAWYELPKEYAAPTWMVLAFAAAVVGRKLKLKRFSFQAYALALAAFVGALQINLDGTVPHTTILLRLVAVSFVAVLLYVCSRWAALAEITGANAIRALHTWSGTALVALLAWYEAPAPWTAVAWAALGMILIFLGQRTKHLDLSIQSFILTTAALISTLSVNLLGTPLHIYHYQNVRLMTVLLVASLIYLSSHWTELAGALGVAVGQAWGASAVLALLAWYELRPEYAAPAWMVLAFTGAVVGRALKLKRFSFQAYALALTASAGALGLNLIGTSAHSHDLVRLAAVSLVAVLLYVCSRWAALVEFQGAREISALHTWLGTGFLAALAWYETPCDYTAPIWCGMALALVAVGSTLKRRSLAVQGHCLAAAGIFSALTVNLYSSATLGHFDGLLLATVGICVAFLYLCSPWSGSSETAKQWQIPEAYTWAASTLVFLLAWYELEPVAVAVAWALFGSVLFELGFGRPSNSLRWQSYAALGGSFARMFYVNINATGNPGEISPRVWTMLFLAAAFFYVYARLAAGADDSLERDRKLRTPPVLCYFGSITVAALMRAELDPNWVAAAWAAMIVVLLALAWQLHRRIFLEQGLILSLAVLYRAVLFNCYESHHLLLPSEHTRLLYVGVTVALLFLAVPLALQLRPGAPETVPRKGGRLARLLAALSSHPEQVVFFMPFGLLTALLFLEIKDTLTLAWGLEALVVFVFALWAGVRSFRLSAIGLLLVCVGRIAVHDLWIFGGNARWLTGIGLGATLILVGYMSIRFRESIRKYL